jgi:gamma-glutamyltranspeptidase / glutathione hydrolase
MARAMIACADPRAAEAGLDVLRGGGNAVDAAITVAAMLTVVDFANTGIGGDMFALVWMADDGAVRALNASGRAPRAASADFYRHRGYEAMPARGPLAVNTPGALDGWQRLLDRFGTRPLGELLAPAIATARDGFELNQRMADNIAECDDLLSMWPTTARIFLPGGLPPKAGDRLCMRDLAETYRRIADEGIDVFYRGAIADAIADAFAEAGGLLAKHDLMNHESNWVEPIARDYRGHCIYEMPPNTQGVCLLQQLALLEGWDLSGLSAGERVCRQVEAKRIAFADRNTYVTDPEFEHVPVEALVSDTYAEERRASLNLDRIAENIPPGDFGGDTSDTTYLAVVDEAGNCVSFINSLFAAMGSTFVAGDTGVLFQNRGSGFSLDPSHRNRIEPGKRTMHTLNPLMVFRDDRPYLVMGTIGGDQQTAGTQQILVNHIDLSMLIEEAVAAPRWCSGVRTELFLEGGVDEAVPSVLAAKGYTLMGDIANFGGAQAIRIDPDTGALTGASDHRVDGKALGY